jgi:hypothetical protein
MPAHHQKSRPLYKLSEEDWSKAEQREGYVTCTMIQPLNPEERHQYGEGPPGTHHPCPTLVEHPLKAGTAYAHAKCRQPSSCNLRFAPSQYCSHYALAGRCWVQHCFLRDGEAISNQCHKLHAIFERPPTAADSTGPRILYCRDPTQAGREQPWHTEGRKKSAREVIEEGPQRPTRKTSSTIASLIEKWGPATEPSLLKQMQAHLARSLDPVTFYKVFSRYSIAPSALDGLVADVAKAKASL